MRHNKYYYNDSIIDSIEELAGLKDGWDCGSGNRIPETVISKALDIYYNILAEVFHKFNMSVCPYGDGGIILTFGVKNDFIDVIVNENLSLRLVHEKGTGLKYNTEEDIDNANFRDIIDRLNKLCNSSGQFISAGLISPSNALTATPSKTIKVPYHYSKKIARSKQAGQMWNTSKSSTGQLLATQ